jgi:hypothetical protein
MGVQFDFRLHKDTAELHGTQYFELAPGKYTGKHWQAGSRFIDECAFSLFEGIFEKRIPGYDHFGWVAVQRQHWDQVLRDVAVLRTTLNDVHGEPADLPLGSTLMVQPAFQMASRENQRALDRLLAELEAWLSETLVENEAISVLGL